MLSARKATTKTTLTIKELGWPHPSLVQQMSLGFEELPRMLVTNSSLWDNNWTVCTI
jgi:hypothetical protein